MRPHLGPQVVKDAGEPWIEGILLTEFAQFLVREPAEGIEQLFFCKSGVILLGVG